MAEWTSHTFPTQAQVPRSGSASGTDRTEFKGVRVSITHSDSPYTVLASTVALFCNTASAVITVNLPAVTAANNGRIVWIKNSDTTAAGNSVTIDGNASENIDDATTFALVALDGVTLVADSATSQWWIV